jgi:hypothetical protein
MINSAAPTPDPSGPMENADSRRQLMYPGSKKINQRGFRRTRRAVT